MKFYKRVIIFIMVSFLFFFNMRIDMLSDQPIKINLRQEVYTEVEASAALTVGFYFAGLAIAALVPAVISTFNYATSPNNDFVDNLKINTIALGTAVTSVISSRYNVDNRYKNEIDRAALEYDQTGAITLPEDIIKELYKAASDFLLGKNIQIPTFRVINLESGSIKLLQPVQSTLLGVQYFNEIYGLFQQPDGRSILGWKSGTSTSYPRLHVPIHPDYMSVRNPYIEKEGDKYYIKTADRDWYGLGITHSRGQRLRILFNGVTQLENTIPGITQLLDDGGKFPIQDYSLMFETFSDTNANFVFALGGSIYSFRVAGEWFSYGGFWSSIGDKIHNKHYLNDGIIYVDNPLHTPDFNNGAQDQILPFLPYGGLPINYPQGNTGWRQSDPATTEALKDLDNKLKDTNSTLADILAAIGVINTLNPSIPVDMPADSTWDIPIDETTDETSDDDIPLTIGALGALIGAMSTTLDIAQPIGKFPKLPELPSGLDILQWLKYIADLFLWLGTVIMWIFAWIVKILLFFVKIIMFLFNIIITIAQWLLTFINLVISLIINTFLMNLLNLISYLTSITKILPSPINYIANTIFSIVGASVGIKLIRSLLSIGRS